MKTLIAIPLTAQASGTNNALAVAGSGGIDAYQVAMLSGGYAYPADGDNATHAGLVFGMATTTANEGNESNIRCAGEIKNYDWDLTPGAIYYVGSAGTISISPGSGFWQKIGIAVDEFTLIIQIGEPIEVI